MTPAFDYKTATSLCVCPDTNVFVEFIALAEAPWGELAPQAAEIIIDIPFTVSEEMDGHKSGGARLRRRALDFNKMARAMEGEPDETLILRENGPRVSIRFAPVLDRRRLDSDTHNLDDNDGRIVAEVCARRDSESNILFLSDDTKTIRLARSHGLATARPPENWRRHEGPDERDQHIEDLQRQLGAQPLVSVSFNVVDSRNPSFSTHKPSGLTTAVDATIAGILLSHPAEEEQTLIDKYGIDRSPFGLSGLEKGLTDRQLDEYAEECESYRKRVPEVVAAVVEALAPSIFVEFSVANEGHAIADRVHVVAVLKGPFKLFDLEGFTAQLEELLDPPSPPRPRLDFSLPNFQPPLRVEKRTDWFYPHNEVEVSKDEVTSWRCEEFRHGDRQTLDFLVIPMQQNASGALHLTVSSGGLAKPLRYKIRLEDRRFEGQISAAMFLRQRSAVWPDDVHDAIQGELEKLEDEVYELKGEI